MPRYAAYAVKQFSAAMVWYGMVNVDLYSAIVTKVSNALLCMLSLRCCQLEFYTNI